MLCMKIKRLIYQIVERNSKKKTKKKKEEKAFLINYASNFQIQYDPLKSMLHFLYLIYLYNYRN